MWPFKPRTPHALPPERAAHLFIARKWFFFQETKGFAPDTPLSAQLAAFSARYLDQLVENDPRLAVCSPADLRKLLLDGIASTGLHAPQDLEQASVTNVTAQQKVT